MTPNVTPGDITHLRACARTEALGVTDWPTYGTTEWLQLPENDPRSQAAILEAAEHYRQHLEDAYGYAHRRALQTITEAATKRAERRHTTRTRPPHTLTATRGWPPIQIPGRPGTYLTPETSA